jgi:aspartate-semialdehyde dehydrogenase
MTYQAASGAGARQLRELVVQMRELGQAGGEALDDPATAALEIDRRVTARLQDPALPTTAIGAPLAASLLPWIDRKMDDGSTREEWKGYVEANKILQLDPPVPVDGICVRVGALRCHSQAVTIKLNREVPLDEIEAAIREANPWTEIVPNNKEATLARLTPAAVTGTLAVPVGRLRFLRMGPTFLTAMTVGDQLLWGAAEPLRRVLRIVCEHES